MLQLHLSSGHDLASLCEHHSKSYCHPVEISYSCRGLAHPHERLSPHQIWLHQASHLSAVLLQGPDGELEFAFEPACHLGAKLAGVHWWFKSRAHAAELTAGYYNTRERDGYADVMRVLKRRDTRLSFTCVEMRDCEHPPEGRCSPEGQLEGSAVGLLSALVPPRGNAFQRVRAAETN